MPIRFRFGPGQAHGSVPKAGSGRDPSCFPWLFRSGYKSPRWTELQLGDWQTANSSGPSQKALCCVRHDCWRVPVCHPPGIGSGMATALSSNATPFQGLIWMPSCLSSHLPMPTKPPEQAFPVPDAWHIVLLLATLQTTVPYGTTSRICEGSLW